MVGISVFQLLLFIGYLLIFAIPVGIILKRLGYSSWFAIISVIPLVNFVFLWLLAFAKWPNLPQQQRDRA